MRRFLMIILLTAIASSEVCAQKLDFYREDLTFILDDSSFTVTGYYYFLNTSDDDEKLDLFYPFPADKTFGAISDVYAYKHGNPLKNALLHYNDKAAMINLEVNRPLEGRINIDLRSAERLGRETYLATKISSARAREIY